MDSSSVLYTFCGLGGGQNAAFNWWYTTFLPGALTLICSLIVLKDEKVNIVVFYHCQLK